MRELPKIIDLFGDQGNIRFINVSSARPHYIAVSNRIIIHYTQTRPKGTPLRHMHHLSLPEVSSIILRPTEYNHRECLQV